MQYLVSNAPAESSKTPEPNATTQGSIANKWKKKNKHKQKDKYLQLPLMIIKHQCS